MSIQCTALSTCYKPIPDIVVAPVTRHLVSLVGMLVGKKVKMATATNGGLNLPAANTIR